VRCCPEEQLWYTETWAAAEYFKFVLYPTTTSWMDVYYVVRWTDATSGTSANSMPDYAVHHPGGGWQDWALLERLLALLLSCSCAMWLSTVDLKQLQQPH
jgi:hypothetical protein